MFNTFFSSDHHFGHDNIIKHSSRPFKDATEMNRVLIENWNAKVKRNDVVYYIGDFAYGAGLKNPDLYFKKLNGKKHLIKGNHDIKKTLQLPWESVNDMLEISVNKQKIVLCHYAMRVWHHGYRGVWMLHGHSHCTLPEKDELSFDVGVDGWNYYPLSFDEVKKKMQWKLKNESYFKEKLCNLPNKEISDKQNEVFKIIKETNKIIMNSW